jgi:hypothetical protein
MDFLASARKHEPETRVVVYDLGLTPAERNALETNFPYDVRTFDYSRYPAFFDIRVNAGEYAWKPAIIREVASETADIVCWMDAGHIILRPLTGLRWETRRIGHYSPHSLGTIADWTHPGMLSYLGLPPDWRSLSPNLSGGTVAFDMRNPAGARLLNEWADLALIKECIAPEGSSRANHRQDQALLSVLAYRAGRPASAASRLLGFLIQQDNKPG